MENLIYIINSGTPKQYFSNESHFKNFVKYLFSNSKSHEANEHTAYNFYVYKTDTKSDMSFVKPNNNKKAMEDFNKNFKEEIKQFKKYYMDLNYVLFAYIIDDIIVSNMVIENEGDVEFTFPEEMFNYVIQDYHKNKQDEFFKTLNNFLQKGTKIINYEHADLKYRKLIELELHKLFSKKENRLLISMSHNDQGVYHIHRILKD